MDNKLDAKTVDDLLLSYPFIEQFFEDNNLNINNAKTQTFTEFITGMSKFEIEDLVIDKKKIIDDFYLYINEMLSFLGLSESNQVQSLTILPGHDKSGNTEGFSEIILKPGEIVSIVGPTGSGKSRLLADIEWTAQNDTPTNRQVLINGEKPNLQHRFSPNQKLVAQLSQNMNFVMDLTVQEFIELHAESRNISDIPIITEQIISASNKLAGESFQLSTPITALSGGQSRALMIADTAILSSSPIVLIDEIENAGIDRQKALDVLVSQDKIILMATHDPALALLANRRLIIKNGGIAKIIETTEEEKKVLDELSVIDNRISQLRKQLRVGEILK